MYLHEKYQLDDAAADLSGASDRTFTARERASGRRVLIHMLAGGYGGENDGLLRAVGRLSPEIR